MSSLQDRYGNPLGTQSVAARDAYLAGVDSLMAATPGMDTAFQKSVEADENFALGHRSLARAKQLLGRGHEAKAPLVRAKELAFYVPLILRIHVLRPCCSFYESSTLSRKEFKALKK